jgi:hypothetical protein
MSEMYIELLLDLSNLYKSIESSHEWNVHQIVKRPECQLYSSY